jgi:hypothetical protein
MRLGSIHRGLRRSTSLPHAHRFRLKGFAIAADLSREGRHSMLIARILVLIATLLVIKSLLPRKQRRWPTTPVPYDD